MNSNKNKISKAEKELKAYYDSLPDWYWKHGLHDAQIKSVKEINRPEKRLRNNDYNLLEMRLDSSGAVYENDIKELDFYNYRVVSGNYNSFLNEAAGGWWLYDEPSVSENGKCSLVLVLEFVDREGVSNSKYAIEFERVEIIRNK